MKYATILCLFGMLSSMGGNAQELKSVDYQDGEQKLKGMVTSNAVGTKPGVLILPAWKGIDQEAKTAALDLEKQGYIAFIADIYGVGNTPADNQAASGLSSKYKSDFKLYQSRIQAALMEMKKQGADKVAVIGYCFGGTGALEAARGGLPVEGVVCIHGGLAKAADRPNEAIKAKVLVEHPANDASVKKEDIEQLINEMNEGKADWQIITYANSKHTFTNPESPDYNETMAKRAWNHTLLFLQELLK
ncbi:MAG: dienelactone hydrolase family protein [Sphingobacterium hotanense]